MLNGGRRGARTNKSVKGMKSVKGRKKNRVGAAVKKVEQLSPYSLPLAL